MYKLTKQEIANEVKAYGLGDTIWEWVSAENIEDLELAKAWRKADKAIEKVYELIVDVIVDGD